MTRLIVVVLAIIMVAAITVHGARNSNTNTNSNSGNSNGMNAWAHIDRHYTHQYHDERSVQLVSPPLSSLADSSSGMSTLSLEPLGLPATNFKHTQTDVDNGEWIVTVKSPISDSYRELLTSEIATLGGRLTNYLPHDSFLVAGRSHTNDAFASSLLSLSGVRDVQPFTAVSKISPSLDIKQAHNNFVMASASSTPTNNDDMITVHKLRVHVSSHGIATASMVTNWQRGMIADGVLPSNGDTDLMTLINDRYIDIIVRGSYVPSVMWLASRHDVHFIESRNQPFVIQNKYAQAVIQDNNKWSNTTSIMWRHGITGEGQVVSLGDTGIDYDSCFFHDPQYPVPVGTSPSAVNMKHRKIVMYVPMGDASDYAMGHGTHVAGSIAGEVLTSKSESYAVLQPYNGMAYKSKLAFWDFKAGAGGDLLIPDDLYTDYYLPSQQRTGAAISSNSWGAAKASYDSFCADTDRYVNDHQDFLPIYAAGNYGESGLFSISSPGVSKNVLTVGATLNSAASFFELGQAVGFKVLSPSNAAGTYQVVPATFGPAYHTITIASGSPLIISNPLDACSDIINKGEMSGAVVLVVRGTCKFFEKAARIQAAGGKLVLVANNEPGAAIPMGSEGPTQYSIAAGMITQQDWAFVNASASAAGERITIAAPVGFDAPDLNEANMASFSSRGPSPDGRIKPDIVAPGMLVKSSRSDGSITSLQCDATDLLPMQGTSMATPVTAGGVALVRQYYMDGFYPSGVANKANARTPSAALMKATVIASGTNVGGDVRITGGAYFTVEPAPSKYQGFGRVYLSRALPFADSMECDRPSLFIVDYQPIRTGEVLTYCFRARPVMNHPYPLRATLVWSDPAGDVGSANNLVNNLDLFIINNDTQQLVFGNTHSFTDIDGIHWPADESNNVEQVTVNSTTVMRDTLFTVHVRGTNVPKGPQNFSLVVNGFFDQLSLEQCDSAVLCPNSCSNQGTCNRATGICACTSGYAGADCGQKVTPLTHDSSKANQILGTERDAGVPVGGWQYFEYTIAEWMIANVSSGGHTITMTRTNANGDPDMYITVGRDAYPSLLVWDFQSVECDSCPVTPPAKQKPSTADIPKDKLTVGTVVRIGIFGYCCTDTTVSLAVTPSAPKPPTPEPAKPTPTGVVVGAAIGVTLAIFILGFVVVYIRRRRAASSSQGYALPGAPTIGLGTVNGNDGNGSFMPL